MLMADHLYFSLVTGHTYDVRQLISRAAITANSSAKSLKPILFIAFYVYCPLITLTYKCPFGIEVKRVTKIVTNHFQRGSAEENFPKGLRKNFEQKETAAMIVSLSSILHITIIAHVS